MSVSQAGTRNPTGKFKAKRQGKLSDSLEKVTRPSIKSNLKQNQSTNLIIQSSQSNRVKSHQYGKNTKDTTLNSKSIVAQSKNPLAKSKKSAQAPYGSIQGQRELHPSQLNMHQKNFLSKSDIDIKVVDE